MDKNTLKSWFSDMRFIFTENTGINKSDHYISQTKDLADFLRDRELKKHGVFFFGHDENLNMVDHGCYDNSFLTYIMNQDKFIMMCGYSGVKTDDEDYFWFPHAWLVDIETNHLVETTRFDIEFYYGIPLLSIYDAMAMIDAVAVPEDEPDYKLLSATQMKKLKRQEANDIKNDPVLRDIRDILLTYGGEAVSFRPLDEMYYADELVKNGMFWDGMAKPIHRCGMWGLRHSIYEHIKDPARYKIMYGMACNAAQGVWRNGFWLIDKYTDTLIDTRDQALDYYFGVEITLQEAVEVWYESHRYFPMTNVVDVPIFR